MDSNSSGSNSTGNMTLTFVDIQDITVPSGTYKVFRVDSSSKDAVTIASTKVPWSNVSQMFTMSLSVNETDYVGYDTGHLIESNIDFITQPQFSNKPINTTATTQLIEDIIPSQTLSSQTPAPSPTPPSPQQQEASVFLQSVAGLDMGRYTIQSQGATAASFYTCNLTSSDSSLDALFNFNSSHVVWCRLSSSQGSPDFATIK